MPTGTKAVGAAEDAEVGTVVELRVEAAWQEVPIRPRDLGSAS